MPVVVVSIVVYWLLASRLVSLHVTNSHPQSYYYPTRMRRGKVISRVVVVVVVVVVVDTKLPNLEMYAPERVVSIMNMSNLARNWLQYVQN